MVEREREKESGKIPKIVVTLVAPLAYATHSDQLPIGNVRLCQQPQATHALRLDQKKHKGHYSITIFKDLDAGIMTLSDIVTGDYIGKSI